MASFVQYCLLLIDEHPLFESSPGPYAEHVRCDDVFGVVVDHSAVWLLMTPLLSSPLLSSPGEQERRQTLAVALFSADVDAVLGKMGAADFDRQHGILTRLLADEDTKDSDIICDHLQPSDAARFMRVGSSTVCARDMRKLIKCGTMMDGSSPLLSSSFSFLIDAFRYLVL